MMIMRTVVVAVMSALGAGEPAGVEEVQELRQIVQQQQAVIEELKQRLEAVEAKQTEPLSLAATPATVAPAAVEEDPNELKAYWKDGLRLESEDKQFEVHLGGRLQLDWAWFDEADGYKNLGLTFPTLGLGDEEDGVEFRRARAEIMARAYGNLLFRAEYDFAVDSPGADSGLFRDVWIGVDDIPFVGLIRAGQFKEPFSLEEVGTDVATTFLERGLPNVFAPSYNAGFAFQNAYLNDRLNVSAGLFKTVDDWPSNNDSDEDQGFAVSTRITGLPWYANEGRKLLHLGLSYSHRNPDGPIRFRQRPETHLANYYVDTGMFRVDALDLYGTEAVLVCGPFSLQGEYMLARARTGFAGDLDFDGYYMQASYFLTGENRVYKPRSATFDLVAPKANFNPREGGWGAWEIAARYSQLDLSDGPVSGGRLGDYTLGLNWHLNPNAKIMLNYVFSDVEHELYDGNFESLQSRFQVSW